VPASIIARGTQSPCKKLLRVIKPEHVLIVLNIVVLQEIVNLVASLIRFHVTGGPFILTREIVRFLFNFRKQGWRLDGTFRQI
jgi:hypothetical protein